MASNTGNVSSYAAIVSYILSAGYKPGVKKIPFHRDEIVAVAKKLKVTLPKNLGDVLYSYRYRKALPSDIIKTQP